MDKKLAEALNKQFNTEFFSAYQYLALSHYFKTKFLNGFAGWHLIQFKEEQDHAMKIYGYLDDRSVEVKFDQIASPSTSWNSPLEAMEAALNYEKNTTGKINDLFELAASVKDHATNVFLQWYVTEQVEEEATVNEIVERLKLIENDNGALLLLDHELGQRNTTQVVK